MSAAPNPDEVVTRRILEEVLEEKLAAVEARLEAKTARALGTVLEQFQAFVRTFDDKWEHRVGRLEHRLVAHEGDFTLHKRPRSRDR